jgi:hypothetical protein
VYENNSTAEKTITVTVSNASTQQSVLNSQTTTNSLVAKIGVFRPSTDQWFMDFNGNGVFDNCSIDTCVSSYGSNAMLPLVADWEGTGRPSIGVFEPNTGNWHLDNGSGGTLVHRPEILHHEPWISRQLSGRKRIDF